MTTPTSSENPAAAAADQTLPPYRRADLQALITNLYNGDISDEEFHDGIERIINSWKNQFAQPEHPNGWRVAGQSPLHHPQR